MSRRSAYLLVGVSFAIHNAEEGFAARRFIDFMQSRAPDFLREVYAGITVPELQVNLLILTMLGLGVTLVTMRTHMSPVSALAMIMFAVLLGLNALAHAGLSIFARVYMPGLITALVINLPVSVMLLRRARREAWVSRADLLRWHR
jgi:hypothetical protein